MTHRTAADEPTDEAIGAMVAEARRARGLSQSDVGAATGVSQSRIARIETGSRRLTFAQAVVLAELFGVPIEAFVPQPPGAPDRQ